MKQIASIWLTTLEQPRLEYAHELSQLQRTLAAVSVVSFLPQPVSAVALADADGNPATSSAAGWQVAVFPSPPVPDYPSAHAVAGGAAVWTKRTRDPV